MRMRKTCLSNLLLALPMLATAASAKPAPVRLTGPAEVKRFEPLYLRMDLVDAAGCAGCEFGPLEMTEMRLSITYPDGSVGRYAPPIKGCRFDHAADFAPDPTAFSTVIISGGKVVTERPGRYKLVLLGPSETPVSDPLELTVSGDLTLAESQLLETITPENSYEYGLFVYFGGGDHLAKGLEVVNRMARSGTRYAVWAKPVLANNYAQAVYDWKTGRVKRAIDLQKVRENLPGEADPVSENIRISVAGTLLAHKGYSGLDPELRSRISSIHKRFKGVRSNLRLSDEKAGD